MPDSPGSRFFKIDFHVHTATSPDFRERTASPAQVVESALRAGLEAIAVTDHNSFSAVAAVSDAARGTGLTVFPGFEVNARGGHILAVFDPATPLDHVEEALTGCGIGKTSFGNPEVLGNDILQVMDTIELKGGLAIAAHVDGPGGFIQANTQGKRRIEIHAHKTLSALEVVDQARKADFVAGKVPGYSRPIACVLGSDAHSLQDIGTRFTLVRMQTPSIEGLRQAIADPALRIKFPSEWLPHTYPHIWRLVVTQGFLSGQEFLFNPSLNCIIGGAGSGKSTIIEFIRFALDQISAIDHIAADCDGKLQDLARIGAVFQLSVVLETGDSISVTRTYNGNDNPIAVRRDKDGQVLENIDLAKFFPIHAYSQGEVVNISRNPLAQLELLDKHLRIEEWQAEIRSARQELAPQVPGLVRLGARANDRQSLDRDLATTKATLEGLAGELARLQESQATDVASSHHLWIAEKNYLSDLVQSFLAARRSAEEVLSAIDLPPLSIQLPEEATPNKALLEDSDRAARAIASAPDRARQLLLEAIDAAEASVRQIAQQWKDLYGVHIEEYRTLQLEKGQTRITELNSELERLRNEQQRLTRDLLSVDAAAKQLATQLSRRNEILDLITDRQARISALREKKARDFAQKIGDTISLKLIPGGNITGYAETIATLLRGSYAPRETATDIAKGIPPRRLVELIRSGDSTQIDEESHVGKWAPVLVERARANPDTLYSIEATPIEDLLQISMKVETGSYKLIDKLSTGEKATLIVLLSLVEGKQPIVFDQPEDALYNPFIFSEVVQTLRREKDQRQFIFATHNPNISVAADLDLGIVLEGSAHHATQKAAGALDDLPTRGLMVLHLEGGEEAFLTRRKKYGMT